MLYKQVGTEDTQPNNHVGDPHPTGARHELALILVLFVAFRAMTLLAFRPGGQVLDHSDFYWYREFAQLTRQGYTPYVNLWAPYPPLFPVLMVGLWRISSLLPPWEFPSLWFALLMGGTFLLFEAGTLILIYAIARQFGDQRRSLRAAWFYAILFTPVYTLTGWFESFPIFFFLLSLYLLLRGHPFWSAITTGIGFMIKLIPLILLPVGARLSNNKYQTANGKGQWTRRRWCITVRFLNLSFDICHLFLYFGAFALTAVAIGLPFYLRNSRLVWGSLVISGARGSWQTVWALLEGEFGYGIVPLDMRDLAWDPASSPGGSSLPWILITLAPRRSMRRTPARHSSGPSQIVSSPQ